MSWTSRVELADLLGMKLDSFIKMGERQGWATRQAVGARGRYVEVDEASLPSALQDKLALARRSRQAPLLPPPEATSRLDAALPEQRAEALAKVRVLQALDAHLTAVQGRRRTAATAEFLDLYNRGRVDQEA